MIAFESNLWTRSTTEGMRQYLHDIGARVYFTGERWGEKCRKGAWEWKTTETLQQFLNDNFAAKLGIDFIRFTQGLSGLLVHYKSIGNFVLLETL